jgi:hypothetical protein
MPKSYSNIVALGRGHLAEGVVWKFRTRHFGHANHDDIATDNASFHVRSHFAMSKFQKVRRTFAAHIEKKPKRRDFLKSILVGPSDSICTYIDVRFGLLDEVPCSAV